jgi:hypothetical protein
MGPLSRVAVLRDGSYIVRSIRVKSSGLEIIDEPRLAQVTFLLVVEIEGEWRVWGSPDGQAEEEIVDWVEVPWIASDLPPGPIS